ncbi:ABC transporter permease subunit [Paraburkholderia sp.]|uniref:ABC transporter permease subunit n=1 Tax=Paraburkholderia sp. TaxID=1926495 RepID=UPI0039E29928
MATDPIDPSFDGLRRGWLTRRRAARAPGLRRASRFNSIGVWGLLPVCVLFVVVYGAAMMHMLLFSVGAPQWSLDAYTELFAERPVWIVLRSTLALAAGVTLISALLGYPIALVMLRARPKARLVIGLALTLPLWTSTLVRSYAWMVILGNHGILNQWLLQLGVIDHPLSLLYRRGAVYIGMVHIMLPYMVFPIYSAMKQVDERLARAARSLGASAAGAQMTVFVPLSLPGVAVGCVLVFVMSLGFWVTPTLLGGIRDSTYVMLIDNALNAMNDWHRAAAMSVLFFVVVVVALALLRVLLGVRSLNPQVDGGAARRRAPSRRIVSAAIWSVTGRVARITAASRLAGRAGWRGLRRRAAHDAVPASPASWAVTVLSLIFLVGPIVVLFPLSFCGSAFLQFPPHSYSLRWYVRYFESHDWVDPTLLSVRIALIVVALAVPIGTLCALGLVRLKSRVRIPLLVFLLSPLIVPPVVLAVAFYLNFAKFGLVGTTTGIVLAHLILTIPYVIVVVLGALTNFDFSLETASRSLGAKPLTTALRIIIPMIWPSIFTAALFAFLTSFDEVVIAVFLSGANAVTLPKRLLDATRFEFEPTIASVSVLLIGLTLLIVSSAGLIHRYTRGRY